MFFLSHLIGKRAAREHNSLQGKNASFIVVLKKHEHIQKVMSFQSFQFSSILLLTYSLLRSLILVIALI